MNLGKKNSYGLNLLADPLVDDFIYPANVSEKGYSSYVYVPIFYIKKELLSQFDEHNIEILAAVLFRKKPGVLNPLHSDICAVNNKWEFWHSAINWNLQNVDSYMAWYETTEKEIWPRNPVKKNSKFVLHGVHYGNLNNKVIDENKSKLIEIRKIQGPTLVRTDIPHQVKNLDVKDRWCLSLRTKINYTWEESIKVFQLLINDE